MVSDDLVLFHDVGEMEVGDMCRYTIEYAPDPNQPPRKAIWVRVRNLELGALRAAYLNGPYTLYCDMRPENYDERNPVVDRADEPKYENHVKAGQHFSAELVIPDTTKRTWRVDIASEILFRRKASVKYEITVGTTKHASKTHHAANRVQPDPKAAEFKVNLMDTASLWMQPQPDTSRPLHLVVLTHGLVSNVTADMLYLKEQLDRAAQRSGENLICRGYTGNVCRTERGVKFLGRRVAEWIQDELVPTYRPTKLSFIAHSLGGLIQTYALGYICMKDPHFFDNIELEHFVTLASPMLGISAENPGYVRFALDFGVAGKTGRDLGLSWVAHGKPLLENLPHDPVNTVLKQFKYRTVYANAVHDGIVPLRTSSLLYLDWRAIAQANAARDSSRTVHFRHHRQGSSTQRDDVSSNSSAGSGSQAKQLLSRDSSEQSSTPSKEKEHGFSFGLNHKRKKIITRSQTISHNPDGVGEAGMDDDNAAPPNGEANAENLPRKTSLIESGMSLLLPPHPDHRFIADPSCRENVIFHDRIYRSEDLPERRFKRKFTLNHSKHHRPTVVEAANAEELIARAYHDDMTWRKVLVKLLPEAHNNIVVRRRFSNAYGWPVIQHLADMFEDPGPVPDSAEKIGVDDTATSAPDTPQTKTNSVSKTDTNGSDSKASTSDAAKAKLEAAKPHSRDGVTSDTSSGSEVSASSALIEAAAITTPEREGVWGKSDSEESDTTTEHTTTHGLAMLSVRPK